MAAWSVFVGINVILMFALPGAETVPFHFIWISTMLVYGLWPWPPRETRLVLAAICSVTGVALCIRAARGGIGWEETTEVPLMAWVFLSMVWHVRRRAAAVQEANRLAEGERRRRDEQRRFVRLASHELRTPVTVARGYTELIRDAHQDPGTALDTAVVLEELDRLERISARLLTLAETIGPDGLAQRLVDVDELLTRAMTRWRPVADRQWDVTSDAGSAPVDPERIETALDSLLENAVRHTEPNGRIRLTGSRDNGCVVIRVQDDGLGIPQAELPYVFESFRSSGSRAGTGIGLAIVKAVVDAHNGTVCAESRPPKGAQFVLRLPSGPRYADAGG